MCLVASTSVFFTSFCNIVLVLTVLSKLQPKLPRLYSFRSSVTVILNTYLASVTASNPPSPNMSPLLIPFLLELGKVLERKVT